jgi:hypothetical protein
VLPYVVLAIAAVFVLLVVLVILGLIVKGVVESSTERYIACREYDLLNRELDRNPQVRLKDIRPSPYINDDLRWAHPGDTHVANHRPPALVDDNGFPSSDSSA